MYKPRQTVRVQRFLGPRFAEDWTERATIVKPPASCLPKPGADWHLVRFSDGGRLYVHETRLRPLAA